jgi:lysozyme
MEETPFQETQEEQIKTTTSTGISFTPTPLKSEPTYIEYFNWLRLKENVRYKAYPDGKDSKGNQKYAIGMGHQILPGEEYLLQTTISEQKVRELFKSDIEKIVADVNSLVKVPLTRNQKLALVSIRYNVGPGGFRSGKLLSTLNFGNYAGVASLIPTFIVTSNGGIFSPGLQNRRNSERDLFVTPDEGILVGSIPQSAPKSTKTPPFTFNPGQFPFIFPKF